MLPRSVLRSTRTAARSVWIRPTTTAAHRSLSSTATRPVLPEPQTLHAGHGRYAIKYIDLQPPVSSTASPHPTIVLIHGAPGSFQDYKYLIPLLQDHARVVAINLPGNGGSHVVHTDDFYGHIRAEELAYAARDALEQLCGDDDHVFVVGHSFGGHATINVTALNEERDARKLNIRGMALLASAGLRIHHVLEKSDLGSYHQQLLSESSETEAAGRDAVRDLFTRVWGFPTRTSTDDYVAALVRCASTDFTLVQQHVERIAHVPAFVAWADDDGYIQDEIFRELSEACAPGPRFVFRTGGHNIQKTKAEFLATELRAWTQRVVDRDDGAATREISEQP